MTDTYDVAIAGGGAAGLTAALMLGRARRRVLIIDDGEPRNAASAHMHGFPSHDGTSPAAFLQATRDQLTTYDITTTAGRVRTVNRDGTGFRLTLDDGARVGARRLLAATGITDVLPDIPGLRDSWGRDVVHCPYCHGWEIRGRRIGVLAGSPMSIHQALLFRQWSEHITLLLHTCPAPEPEQAQKLAARAISVVAGEVARVETLQGRLSTVRLASGEHLELDALAVAPIAAPRAAYLHDLGLTPQPHPSGMGEHLPTDDTGRTTVDGVWAAGNLTNPALNVLGSANAGSMAAGAINADLIAEETAAAIRSLARR